MTRKRLFEHRLVDLPGLETIEHEGRRYYAAPDGFMYPSVTTVIGESLDKSALKRWRKRVGEEEAERIGRVARARGTRFHSVTEAYLMNEERLPHVASPIEVEAFRPVRDVLDRCVGAVFGAECSLWSPRLRTAGRADAVVEFDRLPTILDFKTSLRPKEERWILNYFLQATTYALMFEELTGIAVPQLAVLISVDHDSPQLFVKRTESYRDRVEEVFVNSRVEKELTRVDTGFIIE